MTGTKVNNPEERRVLKVKRKQDKSQPMIDENGQPIEFEDSEEDEFI